MIQAATLCGMTVLAFPADRDNSIQRVVTRNVRRLMAERNVTQEQLAAVLNIRQASVSRRFKGHSPWQLVDLEAIAAAFGVTVVQLLGGIDPVGPDGGGLPRLDSNQRPSDYPSDSEPSDLDEARERRRNPRASRWNPFSPRKIS
jgi:transcriptional regulator with XRE-family HTH domain